MDIHESVVCGAVSYCVDQLPGRYRSARSVFRDIDLPRPELLEDLLEEVIAPVRRLFESIGEPAPDVFTVREFENRV